MLQLTGHVGRHNARLYVAFKNIGVTASEAKMIITVKLYIAFKNIGVTAHYSLGLKLTLFGIKISSTGYYMLLSKI